jgi:hypothetical protein
LSLTTEFWDQDLQSVEMTGLVRSLLEDLQHEENLVVSLEREFNKAQKVYHREFTKANRLESSDLFRRLRERDEAMSRSRQAQEMFSKKAVSTIHSTLDLLFEQAEMVNKQHAFIIGEVRQMLSQVDLYATRGGSASIESRGNQSVIDSSPISATPVPTNEAWIGRGLKDKSNNMDYCPKWDHDHVQDHTEPSCVGAQYDGWVL